MAVKRLLSLTWNVELSWAVVGARAHTAPQLLQFTLESQIAYAPAINAALFFAFFHLKQIGN